MMYLPMVERLLRALRDYQLQKLEEAYHRQDFERRQRWMQLEYEEQCKYYRARMEIAAE